MKKIFILVFLILSSAISINAQSFTVYNDLGVEFASGDTICANRPYYIVNDAGYQEITILDAQTHVILEVLNANVEELEVVFPENAGEIQIIATAYDENGNLDPSTSQSTTVTVEPCEYDVVKADYVKTAPMAKMEYVDGEVVVTPPTDVPGYTFTYKFVDEEKSHEETKTEPFNIKMDGNTVLQVTESYTHENGETITNYFEIEIDTVNNTYFVRNVDSFDVITIDAMELVNKKLLVAFLFVFILLIVFIRKSRKVKRKIKRREMRKQNDT